MGKGAWRHKMETWTDGRIESNLWGGMYERKQGGVLDGMDEWYRLRVDSGGV